MITYIRFSGICMYWSVDPPLPYATIPQINCELAASLDSALQIAMKTMTMSQFTYPIVHHSLVNAVLIPIDLITLVCRLVDTDLPTVTHSA